MTKVARYIALGLILVTSLLGGVVFSSCKAEKPAVEPIRFACYVPLSGEFIKWGEPMHQGLQAYFDAVLPNGLYVAGEWHPIEYKGYDNIAYIPAKELEAVRKAILEDNMKFAAGTWTEACREATDDFINEHEQLLITWGGGSFLKEEHPFILGGQTGPPANIAMVTSFVHQQHPEIRTAAIVSADTAPGLTGKIWYEIGARAEGLDIVYNEIHPSDLVDFYPLVTSILATEPDVMLCSSLAPPAQALLVEAAKSLGYTGYFVGDSWSLDVIGEKVPLSYIANKAYSLYADWASPGMPEVAAQMHERFIEMFGEENWEPYAGLGVESWMVIEVGIKGANSIDPVKVKDWLLAQGEIDHPLFGKATWGGEELYGCNHLLQTPVVATITYETGFESFFISASDWWNAHRDVAVEVLEREGLLYKG